MALKILLFLFYKHDVGVFLSKTRNSETINEKKWSDLHKNCSLHNKRKKRINDKPSTYQKKLIQFTKSSSKLKTKGQPDWGKKEGGGGRAIDIKGNVTKEKWPINENCYKAIYLARNITQW
jgi:hypothetical protein